MLGSHLAGLRGGLEAALIVGLLAAWLVRAGRRGLLRPLGAGVGMAVVAALGFGCALEFGARELRPEAGRLLGGVLSVLAAALVTWALFRLRVWVVVGAGFLVVGREGLETALFVWASVRAAADPAGSAGPLGMVLLGLAVAVALGWSAHRGVLRLPAPGWFRGWTSGLLVVATAGVLARGLRDLQDAGLLGGGLPGASEPAFDLGGAVSPDRWHGALLEGVFNVQPDPTVLQVTVWALYLVPALGLAVAPVGFGRSVRVGVEEQKATDETAGERTGSGAGPEGPGRPGDTDAAAVGDARRGLGAGPGGERLRDGARRAGGRTDGVAG